MTPARPLRRVVICGAGAVGASWAERLHDHDPAGVALLAGGERADRLRREGLVVNGRRLDLPLVAPGAPGAPADLLVVAVKAHQLPAAIEDARRRVAAHTLVLPLLNGITSGAVLAAAFGAERVLHAFVVGNDVQREGTRVRYSRMGEVVFGVVPDDAADPRVLAVKELLDRARIPARVPADVRREQWWKFMLNVGVNQVSAVLRSPFAAFAVPEVRDLVRRAALEVVALAPREGVALGPEDVERIFPIMATLAPDGFTSMAQDVAAQRKTEVELFAGTVVELGRKHGVPTPVNALLGDLLAALERLSGVR